MFHLLINEMVFSFITKEYKYTIKASKHNTPKNKSSGELSKLELA
jgi:hypothetical protein